jgi:hypothetical protein
VVDHTPDQEETPKLQGRYTVGDYINLDLTIWHAMHIVEASVVFVLVDDDTMELVIAGRRDRTSHGRDQTPPVREPPAQAIRHEGVYLAEEPAAGRLREDHLQPGRHLQRLREKVRLVLG